MSVLEKYRKNRILGDVLFFLAGGTLFALSVKMFAAPNQIAPGGVTGLATVLNYLFHFPIGGFVLLCNLPIFLWAVLELGYKMVAKTIAATVIYSFMIDFLGFFIPPYQGDPILATIFGGVLEGAGLSLAFLRGATTGGSDMVARLLEKRFRHISMGKLMLGVDAGVVALSGFAYRSLESALYAFLMTFISTKLIDSILYGTDVGTGKILYIMSEKNEEISGKIIRGLERGVTKLSCRGAYSGREGEVLLCAVRRDEVYAIHEIVGQTDPNAFLIVGEAGEISGEGFRQRKSQEKTLKELWKEKRKRRG